LSPAFIAALFFTLALFMVTAYFIMGSLPLLILKHDTPLDSRFIRGFFNTYYLAAMLTASATAVCYAFAARPGYAAGAAALALVAYLLRRKIIPKMDSLRAQIQLGNTGAVPGFRRIHMAAVVVNVAQLVLIIWSLITLSMQLR
jgi:hypothetical protein